MMSYQPGLTFSPLAGYGGVSEISLSDIVSTPDQAFQQMSSNFMNNWQQMAITGFMVGLTFKFTKRLLRKQIANINRNIMKPAGLGFKL